LLIGADALKYERLIEIDLNSDSPPRPRGVAQALIGRKAQLVAPNVGLGEVLTEKDRRVARGLGDGQPGVFSLPAPMTSHTFTRPVDPGLTIMRRAQPASVKRIFFVVV
jgi:hypothetical protein